MEKDPGLPAGLPEKNRGHIPAQERLGVGGQGVGMLLWLLQKPRNNEKPEVTLAPLHPGKCDAFMEQGFLCFGTGSGRVCTRLLKTSRWPFIWLSFISPRFSFKALKSDGK